jgi:hypothetical protein
MLLEFERQHGNGSEEPWAINFALFLAFNLASFSSRNLPL